MDSEKGKALSVVISMAREISSFNAALSISDLLRIRGHRVTFAGFEWPRIREHVERNGFQYVTLEEDESCARREYRGPLKSLRKRFARERATAASVEHLVSNVNPDIIFLDIGVSPQMWHAFSRHRRPTLLLLPNYASRFSGNYPPVTWSRANPEGKTPDHFHRAKCLMDWSRTAMMIWANRARRWIRDPRTIPDDIYNRHTLHQVKKYGWNICFSEWGARPQLPEVVVGYGSLDWSALRRLDHRSYLAGTSLPRVQTEDEWSDGVDSSKTLIYCNVSTLFLGLPASAELPAQLRPYKRFIDVVINAVRRRPDWQLIVSCGPFAQYFPAHTLPTRIKVLAKVAQIDVLRQADLAITQGGAGTVRECLEIGVPMLVFPMWSDQYGNASRVEHYGVGVHGDYRTIQDGTLTRMADRVIGSPAVKAAVSRLQLSERQTHSWSTFAKFVNAHTGLLL